MPAATTSTTKVAVTVWHMTVGNGGEYRRLVIPGDGRISVGRAARADRHEVRFYRDQTTKTFDAFIPDVIEIWSDRVTVDKGAKSSGSIVPDWVLERVEEEEKRKAKEAEELKEFALKHALKKHMVRPGDEDDDDLDELMSEPARIEEKLTRLDELLSS